MAKQHGSDSNWEGMLKRWSLFYPDGTLRPSSHSDETRRPVPKWRGKALEMFMIHKLPPEYDIDDRVYDIACTLMLMIPEGGGNNLKKVFTSAQVEELLDELQEYVESIDVAKVIHSDGFLLPLLPRLLYNNHANIRAKAAELVTTMVKNNPTSQQLVMEVNGLHPLLCNFTSDPDATSRTKALRAISALICNNEPGITAFRLANGYASLRGALSSESVGLQRDALNLIQYLLHENSPDCNIVTELGLPCIMMHLASSDDAEVREAALRGLLVLARDEEGVNSGQLIKNDDILKQVLQELIVGINAIAPEDVGVARKEIQLVDSLWNACYNEPSSLGEKGLLVLPGEDAPAPLRAWADAEAADRNSLSEKEDPLLLGLGPPSAASPAYQSNSSSKRRKLQGLVPPSAATPTVQGDSATGQSNPSGSLS